MIAGYRITFLPKSIVLTDMIERDYLKVSHEEIAPELKESDEYKSYINDKKRIKEVEQKDISKQSIRKLSYAINTLYDMSEYKTVVNHTSGKSFKFKLSFLTLTLPSEQGIHTDNRIKRECLNRFLIYSKRQFKLSSYVWKAEPQENGNIHFHITTDIYIEHQKLRDLWNNCVAKLGFLDSFYSKFNHYSPNSTDIHAVYKTKDLAIYLAKYLSKTKGARREIIGKKWNCSNNLSYERRYRFVANSDDIDYFFRLAKVEKVKFINEDFYSVIAFNDRNFYNKLPSQWKDKYKFHLKYLKNCC